MEMRRLIGDNYFRKTEVLPVQLTILEMSFVEDGKCISCSTNKRPQC